VSIVFKVNFKDLSKDKDLKLSVKDILFNEKIDIRALDEEQREEFIKALEDYIKELDKRYMEKIKRIKEFLRKKERKHKLKMRIIREKLRILKKRLRSKHLNTFRY